MLGWQVKLLCAIIGTGGVSSVFLANDWLGGQSLSRRDYNDQQWKCYKLLTQQNVGDFLACFKEEQNISESPATFYLWTSNNRNWGEDDNFIEISQIKVEANNEISFLFAKDKETNKWTEKKLKANNQELKTLSEKTLSEQNCKLVESNQISCTTGKYNLADSRVHTFFSSEKINS